MTAPERLLLVLAVTIATATLAAGLGRTDLWPPNETRVAEIAREMLDGDWSVPRLNGEPFLEEPPLFYWLQATLYSLGGGASAAAARLPAAIGAMVGVLVTIVLARALGANAGIAALVLATAPEYWWMARTGTPDTANAAATGVALVAFYLAWRSGSMAMLAVAVAAAAVAFWLKSLLGVGLAIATAMAFLVVAGRGALRPRQLASAALALAAAVGCWLLLLWRAEGEGGLSFFVVTNHLGRLVGSREQGHIRPVYYYAPNLALDLLPWSAALPAAVVAAWRQRGDREQLVPLLWAGMMTILLTASATKSAHYLLPAYPAFAVLVAQWWSQASDTRLDRLTWAVLTVMLLVAFPVAALVVTSIDPATAIPTLAERHDAQAALRVLLDTRVGGLAWWAVLVLLTGIAFVGARRASRPALAAVAAGTCGILVHLLVVIVALPAFDPFTSARPVGEALGRVARDGVDVFTYGFDNREAPSPFMFYAGRLLPAVPDAEGFERRLSGGRACALVPARAYARLTPRLLALPVEQRAVGELSVVLVSGSAGGCPAIDAPARGARRGGRPEA